MQHLHNARALEIIGIQVRNERAVRGWSQGRVAEEADVAERTVWAIEHARIVRMSLLLAVLDALGLSLEAHVCEAVA